jgi:glucose/mannose transport system substrate-binding protein
MTRQFPFMAFGLSAVLLIAACGSEGGDTAEGGSSGDAADSLEVFSWWTSGSEDAALQQLITAYTASHSDVEVVNGAVAGGGGGNAQQILQTRIQGGDPPDTWQTHLGSALDVYLDADTLAPATEIYDANGFRDVMPEALIESMSRDGEIWAVPTGAHRGNVLWYSVPVLEAAGVEPPGEDYTLDQFITDLAAVDASGSIGLCLGGRDAFAPAELFENTLLGVVGPDGWESLTSGDTPWTDEGVTTAADYLGQMLEYVDPEASALTWDQAAIKLANGECAFNSMGDWAYGEMVQAGAAEDTDFGYVPHPGNDGDFLAVVDAFVVAEEAQNRQGGLDFLAVVGDPEVQLAFNRDKGSSPVRTDVDTSSLPPYQQDAYESWSSDTLVDTIVHGAAMPPTFVQALFEAVTQFIQSRDSDALVGALDSAANGG